MAQPEPVNPVIYQAMNWLVSGLGVVVLLIMSKVVYDWMTGKSSRSSEKQYCPMHDKMESECARLEASLAQVRTRYVDRDEHREEMSLLRDSISGINEKIMKINEHVGNIRVDVGRLIGGKKNFTK